MKLPPLPPGAAPWRDLILRLAARGFDGWEMADLFAQPQVSFDPAPMKRKLWELYRLQFKADRTRKVQEGLVALGYTPGETDGLAGDNTRRAIKAFQKVHGLEEDGEPSDELLSLILADLALPESRRPSPVKTLVTEPARPQVYSNYLTAARLAEAAEFMAAHRDVLTAAEKRYGVPGEFIVGILRVETHFGRYLGRDRALVTLASMAACLDFDRIEPFLSPERALDDEERAFMAAKAEEKGQWALEELEALLLYARANQMDPLALPGSIYGAIGLGQFMPTNALKFGADGDGDGRVDLFGLADAIHSIGAYFQGHGWEGDMSSLEKQKRVLYEYNRSTPYVNTVLAVAHHLTSRK
ncbi:MAG: lytic murein transglycosylase [Thermodesulfobacteriota bacterium]